MLLNKDRQQSASVASTGHYLQNTNSSFFLSHRTILYETASISRWSWVILLATNTLFQKKKKKQSHLYCFYGFLNSLFCIRVQWLSSKESACNVGATGDQGPILGSERPSGGGHSKKKNTPVFLPGESHGHRSLVSYSPQGGKESDMTEVTQHAHC